MPNGDLTQSLLAHLDWRSLLERWSREAVAHAEQLRLPLTREMTATGWIGRPPATASVLEAAERRLGRTLPRSLREFASVTDGWPVLSMDFGALRPVEELGWAVDLEPSLVQIWGETAGDCWPPDADDGAPLLKRSLLLSTGTDHFLLDPRRTDTSGEWASCGFTSWYPGAGEATSSFRTGMEGHYASFVRFTVPDSTTLTEVAEQVERAYRSSLRGDPLLEWVIPAARFFGDLHADVLNVQLRTLHSAYRAALDVLSLDWGHLADEPTVLEDLLPLFITACLDGHDPHTWALDHLLQRAPDQLAQRIRGLADRCLREGGLVADWSSTPGFATAADRARALVRAGRDAEAFEAVITGLPNWQPLSPLHLAPMGLIWDRELNSAMTPDRRRRLLSQPRGTTVGQADQHGQPPSP
ncbi:MAG TPA: SMI1/KNR4 family protein [Kineosporiaceae bacterium]|nr:SMI1/KNR4 family protein [Kineosporiaceae bacterium]